MHIGISHLYIVIDRTLKSSPFLGRVSIKKTLKVMEFSILGGGLPDFHNFFPEKKCFFHKKYKDDQNGLINPEN